MKKEYWYIIIGAIFLYLLYYFLSKKTTLTPETSPVTSAIRSIKKAISGATISSTDVSNVTTVLGKILDLKSKQIVDNNGSPAGAVSTDSPAIDNSNNDIVSPTDDGSNDEIETA